MREGGRKDGFIKPRGKYFRIVFPVRNKSRVIIKKNIISKITNSSINKVNITSYNITSLGWIASQLVNIMDGKTSALARGKDKITNRPMFPHSVGLFYTCEY